MRGAPRVRLWAPLILALALTLASACGGSSEPTPTPGTIIEGNAIQIFLKEANKVGWFSAGDDIKIESEPLLYQQALDKVSAIDLSLYPTVPGTPPYVDGLPGWLIIARGNFFDVPDGATPTAGTPRRPAVAAAFVDTHGGLAYSMRFTDIAPTPQPPKETLPPESPSS
ncbi:MAG TPA: hypothetical protein VLS25_01970 [Dehalococcoidia bacterium]|nr:hypothetical protein [Dehalococcoidia bacterium]